MTLLNILLQSVLPVGGIDGAIQSTADTVPAELANADSLSVAAPSAWAATIKGFDWSGVFTALSTQAVSFCLRLLAAIALFFIGKFIINKIHALTRAVMIKRDFDRSLATFLLSLIRFVLLFLLVVSVIGVLGIETSSFIALFASAGVAIGMALSGTLQNFAGGVLILLLKPFKVNDYIVFGEFKGYVKEIQIFHTILTTYNNDRIIIPNGGLSTGTINNLSSETYRRLEWRVSIAYGDDVSAARRAIMALLDNDARIVKQYIEDHEQEQTPTPTPTSMTEEEAPLSWWKRLFTKSKSKVAEWKDQQQADIESRLPKKDYSPMVAVENLADSGVVLIVRAWCTTPDYWSVLYAINEQIYTTLPDHGIHFPFPQLDVHVRNEG